MCYTKDYSGLKTELGRYLNGRRLKHSVNVAEFAGMLAETHAPELLEQAVTAGLLHDNAKRLGPDELISRALALDIVITEFDRDEPGLLHGKVGAWLLPERFGINDPEISQAVQDHVTGNGNMGTLSEILFVADQAAADRDFAGVKQLRRAAARDLKLAVWMVARFKLLYILGRGKRLSPETMAAYNHYLPAKLPGFVRNLINPKPAKNRRRAGGKD